MALPPRRYLWIALAVALALGWLWLRVAFVAGPPPTALPPRPSATPALAPSSTPDVQAGGFPIRETPRPTATPRPYEVRVDPPANPASDTDAALDRLAEGRLAFNTPERMVARETRVVQLVLTFNRDDAATRALVTEPGRVEGAPVKASAVMEARLVGDAALQVTPVTPEEQAVSRAEPTEWRWNVLAREAGRHYLQLTVTAVLRLDGVDRRRKLQTFSREIEITVAASSLPWPAITAVAVPVLAVAGWLLLSRRQRTKPARAPRLTAGAPTDVFISYARRDLERVRPLAAALEARGIRTWMDLHGIDSATEWAGEIATALRGARVVALMGSKAAFESEYVKREIALADEERKPLFPVMLEEAEAPPALRLHMAGVQRLAADRLTPADVATAVERFLGRLEDSPG